MENNNENENVKNILVLERARESEDSRHAKQLEVVEAVPTKNPKRRLRSRGGQAQDFWCELLRQLQDV